VKGDKKEKRGEGNKWVGERRQLFLTVFLSC
jgi:hypothetical protein